MLMIMMRITGYDHDESVNYEYNEGDNNCKDYEDND
jgi:hypothetical protein